MYQKRKFFFLWQVKKCGLPKCPIYCKLLWLVKISLQYFQQITKSIIHYFLNLCLGRHFLQFAILSLSSPNVPFNILSHASVNLVTIGKCHRDWSAGLSNLFHYGLEMSTLRIFQILHLVKISLINALCFQMSGLKSWVLHICHVT